MKSTPVVNQIKHGLTPWSHCVAHVRAIERVKTSFHSKTWGDRDEEETKKRWRREETKKKWRRDEEATAPAATYIYQFLSLLCICQLHNFYNLCYYSNNNVLPITSNFSILIIFYSPLQSFIHFFNSKFNFLILFFINVI